MNTNHCIVLVSTIGNVFELIGLIIVFILILFATYYTSKWIGKNGVNLQTPKNIEVLETYRVSQTKYLQIVKVGHGRFFLISVTKDNISFISELNEDDIDFDCYNVQKDNEDNFAKILKNIVKKNK